jgi:hypothetical protein
MICPVCYTCYTVAFNTEIKRKEKAAFPTWELKTGICDFEQ